MGARESRSQGAGLLLLTALVGLACASNPPASEPSDPVDVSSSQAEEAPPILEEPLQVEPVPVEPADPAESESSLHPSSDVIVISGELMTDDSEPPPSEPVTDGESLYEASLRARLERARSASTAAIVITDETLGEGEAGGRLTTSDTTVDDGSTETVSAEAGGEASARDVSSPDDEALWRRLILDARLEWREAVERVEEMEELVSQLRYDFYATDDPYLRDSSIKPAWDRALGELEAARGEADLARDEVGFVLEEGRAAGALPGWLREGLDVEPEFEIPAEHGRRLDEHRMADPVEMEEAGDSGGHR